MQLRVISPTGVRFEGEVQRVSLPGTKAPFVVLRSHAPLISSLTAGEIVYTDATGAEASIGIEGGFVEVCRDRIVVCVE